MSDPQGKGNRMQADTTDSKAAGHSMEERVRAAETARDELAVQFDICRQKLEWARRELASVRVSQEAYLEEVARLPAALQERDELAVRLAGLLSREYWRQVHAARHLPLWRRVARRILGRRAINGDEADVHAIEQSPLFDGGYYLREYADVVQAEMSPAVHYLRHGYAEGRNPGPGFDTSWYLKRHADVAAAGVNPLLHYEQSGRAEGRAIRPVRSDLAPPGAD